MVAAAQGWREIVRRSRSALSQQRLRLAAGLVLFAFVLTHYLNHVAGIVSVEWMEAAQVWHRGFWRFPPVEAVLVAALLTHAGLALWKTACRSTFKMSRREALQLGLGLSIPLLLAPHVVGTYGVAKAFGWDDSYGAVLPRLWPGSAVLQSVALAVVWIHAVIGLHMWLGGRGWYRRALPVLFALAVALPLLAEWGWIDAARRLDLGGETGRAFAAPMAEWVGAVAAGARGGYVLLAAVALGAVALRLVLGLKGRRIAITYPGNRVVRIRPGPTLLEISRMNEIPHAAVCGGRARCSTCRTRIVAGLATLAPATAQEQVVLDRIGADVSVRLACQIRPEAPLTVEPLLPVRPGAGAAATPADAYHWGVEKPVAILFVDLRGFTAFSESRLTYDVVFVLNRYLDAMARAVRAEGGHVDKFIGDSVMAIFGLDDGPRAGARGALAAAVRMAEAIGELNAELGDHISEPLRIGIGIHLGPAILGRIGAAGGDSAAAVTALGDTVNTASRLESLTKELGAVLVVSHATVHAAGIVLGDVKLDEVAVRGRRGFLKIYAIGDLGPVAAALAVRGRTALAG